LLKVPKWVSRHVDITYHSQLVWMKHQRVFSGKCVQALWANHIPTIANMLIPRSPGVARLGILLAIISYSRSRNRLDLYTLRNSFPLSACNLLSEPHQTKGSVKCVVYVTLPRDVRLHQVW
jgi:hypothetical protein